MTQKGQVTIPAEIRAQLHLKPRDKVRFVAEADGVRVQPAESKARKGFGAVAPINTPEDWRAVRREFEELVAEDVASEDRRE
ncbi:MAG: AbrB/MazE/SpoVT family DNA-binding domain-containing protein [Thermomicrobiales bacterium]